MVKNYTNGSKFITYVTFFRPLFLNKNLNIKYNAMGMNHSNAELLTQLHTNISSFPFNLVINIDKPFL